eukprot:4453281-Prymnesium_polylepis.1
MAGRLVADPDMWDAVDVTRAVGFARDLSPGFGAVVVYKRVQGSGWTPWVLVTQSAALRAAGHVGRGLYTLRDLQPPRRTAIGYTVATRVGRYSGR